MIWRAIGIEATSFAPIVGHCAPCPVNTPKNKGAADEAEIDARESSAAPAVSSILALILPRSCS
jgi:hypothetical protein